MSKIRFVAIVLFCVFLFFDNAKAQDTENFTQFYFNPSLINASLVGIEGRTALFLGYKKQWLGIPGGPSTGHFNFQKPFTNRMSIGLGFTSNLQGVLGTSAVSFSGSYAIPLSTTQFFRFGFSAGVSSTLVDNDELDLNFRSSGDPALSNLAQNSIQPMGSFGFSFNSSSFHAGVSVPHLFQPRYFIGQAFAGAEFKPFESVLVHGSNRFYFNNNSLIFEPYAIYRFNQTLPSQFEVASLVHVKNVVYVGASYKEDFGISGLAGVRINEHMALGLSYMVQNIGTNVISNPSFEIQLGYLLGERDRKIPSYSFVNTEVTKGGKTTKTQLAGRKVNRPAPKPVAKRPTAAKKKEVAKAPEPKKEEKKPLPIAKTPETKKPQAKPSQGASEPVAQKPVGQRKVEEDATKPALATKPSQGASEPVAQKPVGQQKVEDDATKPALATKPTDAIVPNPSGVLPGKVDDRHKFVKRGDHVEELDYGNYVVVGVFSTQANAKKYVVQLKQRGYNNIAYGFLTLNNRWYVHAATSTEINEVKDARDNFRKMRAFNDAWLLTVHP